MATWLSFADQASAQAAVGVIDGNKGLPASADAVTQTWADPQQTADDQWVVPKCRDEDLVGVGAHDLVEDPTFPSPPAKAG